MQKTPKKLAISIAILCAATVLGGCSTQTTSNESETKEGTAASQAVLNYYYADGEKQCELTYKKPEEWVNSCKKDAQDMAELARKTPGMKIGVSADDFSSDPKPIRVNQWKDGLTVLLEFQRKDSEQLEHEIYYVLPVDGEYRIKDYKLVNQAEVNADTACIKFGTEDDEC